MGWRNDWASPGWRNNNKKVLMVNKYLLKGTVYSNQYNGYSIFEPVNLRKKKKKKNIGF
jgi:hypothetical protein